MTLSFRCAISFLSILLAPQVFATGETAPRSSGGTISFNGRIVESLCDIATDVHQQKLEMRCYRNGRTSLETWSLASLTGAGVNSSLASMDIRYLDPLHKLGILIVSYK